MNTQVVQQEIVSFLKEKRAQGLSRLEAINQLKNGFMQSSFGFKAISALSTKESAIVDYSNSEENLFLVRAGTLGQSLAVVYADEEITPLEMAVLLKLFYDDINEVSLGLKEGYPNLTATDNARILLNPQIYPGTSSNDMTGALNYAGYSPQAVNDAIAALYSSKTSFTVQSVPKWQDSGAVVEANESVSIVYKGGYWTANPATGMVTAYGNSRYRAKSGYTLPGAFEGALIGRVGGRTFLVGNGAKVPAGATGKLEFCINDDLRGAYGAGFNDNRGSVQIEIEENKI